LLALSKDLIQNSYGNTFYGVSEEEV